MKVDLDKIDKLRARIDLGYDEAAAYLEAAGGDLVQALIMAERDIGSAVDGSLDWTVANVSPRTVRHGPDAWRTFSDVVLR